MEKKHMISTELHVKGAAPDLRVISKHLEELGITSSLSSHIPWKVETTAQQDGSCSVR